MPIRHPLDLVSHWRLQAPVEPVWAALADPGGWSRWWPQVRQVRTLREGGADGVGRVCRITWTTRLPVHLEIEVEAIERVHHQRLRGRTRGPLDGEDLWLLRSEGGVTHLTHVWRVHLVRPWMRWLAPLIRWRHARVMRAGERGLQRQLQTPPRA